MCSLGVRTAGQGSEQDAEMIRVKHKPSPPAWRSRVTGMTGVTDAVLQVEATTLTYTLTRKDP